MKKCCKNCVNFDGKYCIAAYEIPYFECVDFSKFEFEGAKFSCVEI